MAIKTVIKKNTYFDSVTLMTISTRANELESVKTAMIGMGTDMNIEVIRDVGLYTSELDDITTGDLMIVLDIKEEEDTETVLAEVEELFTKKNQSGTTEISYKTLDSALNDNQESNIVVISVNGNFAYREVNKALDNDKHVMLFSDNVTIEEELALKQKAHEKELFMMGPDCGTAIINGVGLCFANEVRAGDIGIVGASGTGSQEVSVQIHKHGYGVSQLIGTGGRDLSLEIGGIMMLDGLDALLKDEQTEAILLISKPPAKEVEEKIIEKLKNATKQIVIYFIGSERAGSNSEIANVTFANNSLQAVEQVIQYSRMMPAETMLNKNLTIEELNHISTKLKDSQKYIRGLFCGGTLCDELLYSLMEFSDEVYSNIHKSKDRQLTNPNSSKAHTVIDFGDDKFTEGRPHPMIDPTSRIPRILQEARDPEVAVIALDFELGYGSHEDPAGVLEDVIREAKDIAENEGRELVIVGYVLGTEIDPQDVNSQREKLENLGVLVVDSNHQLCEVAKSFIKGA
ncbi:acyl-CoA synthetase FdrA [Oceanobacillus neutriphilus]|uniref:Acyl-CoA synthetase FdrA n=1 Tax=Oceanobacillus neutriphilus TaxID=531815 RepID=A0ABQ2NUG6_9BACI|nr:acyl-CoA synthetase FdrA [Oceanobacillus neutriphilus]GGP10795.1 hypothetical protein GCM10011346_20340 [Oceanobacillus neutriphilus]